MYGQRPHMPRVSVIIPAFNAEAHIAETLRSVENQTYDDWEIVLGDDGSDDGTVKLASEFGEKLRIVENPKRSGPATARNLAISRSGGELLAFLDADDYWLPGYLEHQVRFFDESQAVRADVGIVACNACVLGPDGFRPGTYMDLVGAPKDVTLTLMLRFNPIFVSALSPRAVVDEAGGFYPESLAEDYDLWIRILELGYRVVSTRRPLAVYRVSPGSASARPDVIARATQVVFRRALERGNLTRRQRRIVRRELRAHRVVEQIVSANGTSYRRLLRMLPLLALVAVEHPNRWLSYARILASGGRRFARFGS
jgi:teichuronic acid biosynthesis glycosyltransferase TuaG